MQHRLRLRRVAVERPTAIANAQIAESKPTEGRYGETVQGPNSSLILALDYSEERSSPGDRRAHYC